MRLDKTANGIRLSADEEVYLDLSVQQHEDVFYAMPLDSANMYLLLNGTVLQNADDRAILQFLVEASGGVEAAMQELQNLVKASPPLSAGIQVEGSATAPAPALPPPVEATPVEPAPVEPVVFEQAEPFRPPPPPAKPPSATVLPPAAATAPITTSVPPPARPAAVPDEPFEIVVHKSAQKPDDDLPRPSIGSPEVVDEPEGVPDFQVDALEIGEAGRTPTPAAMPKPKTNPPAVGAKPKEKRPGTQVFERKPVPPVVIEPQPDGKRVKISVGSKALDLGVVRYEDLYYAMPGDNASLFRLMNDTILSRPEERDMLKELLGLLGGIDAGMTALQEAVTKVEPPPRRAKTNAPAVGSRPPAAGAKPSAPAGKPPSLAPKPAAAGKPATIAPPLQRTGSAPPKPAAGSPSMPAKPPAVAPAARTGGGLGKPAGPPPKPSGPRPFTVSADEELDAVELVDDDEDIPVAPVDANRPGAPPAPARAAAVPPPKPATAAKPAAALPKSKPGGPAPAAKPAAAAAQIRMSKEDVEKTGVKVRVVPQGFQIICKEYYIQLSKAQYQELHYALPMPVMNMFKLVHNDLLKDPQSRGVLMKMIHLAGGPKEFMSALSLQVQNIKPTEDWQ